MIFLGIIAVFILGALLAPVLTPYDVNRVDAANRLSPPSPAHLLGTDEMGRDVLTRMLYGARMSILIGFSAALLSTALGTLFGILAGYFGGVVEQIIMSIADILLEFPSILFAMLLSVIFGGGVGSVFLAISLSGWSSIARMVHAEAISVRRSGYVTAAEGLGAGPFGIMARHVLPNCMPTVFTAFVLEIPSAILSESGLSFLNVGLSDSTISWGTMVSAGRQFLYTRPLLCIAPGIAITVFVFACHYIGREWTARYGK